MRLQLNKTLTVFQFELQYNEALVRSRVLLSNTMPEVDFTNCRCGLFWHFAFLRLNLQKVLWLFSLWKSTHSQLKSVGSIWVILLSQTSKSLNYGTLFVYL